MEEKTQSLDHCPECGEQYFVFKNGTKDCSCCIQETKEKKEEIEVEHAYCESILSINGFKTRVGIDKIEGGITIHTKEDFVYSINELKDYIKLLQKAVEIAESGK